MANRLPSITISGGPELAALLKDLGDKEILSAASKGLRAAGTKTMGRAKKKLARGHGLESGQLKRSLGVRKVKTYKKEGKVVLFMGPRKGFYAGPATRAKQKSKGKRQSREGHDPFYIAHLVEFGHKASGMFAHGQDPRPRPFLRPAVDESKGDFEREVAEKVKSVLEKAKARKASGK